MEQFEYPVLLTVADEGGFVVTCRDLPELITQGEDKDDALDQAADAMDEVFAVYMENGIAFKRPSQAKDGEYMVSPPAETLAKAALYTAMQSAGITKVQLAQKLGVDEKEVRRLLDPRHASKLPRLAHAVEVLGRRLVIGLATEGVTHLMI
jgi:antitoxin HicB